MFHLSSSQNPLHAERIACASQTTNEGSRECELQSPVYPISTQKKHITQTTLAHSTPKKCQRCTYAGNDGEKLIAEETPTSHYDPVYSDFEVTERSRRVW